MKRTTVCLFISILTLTFCFHSGKSKNVSTRTNPLDKHAALSSQNVFRAKRFLRSCSASTSLCKCRRKGTIVCSKTNCLQSLPTANMTRETGVQIRRIIVTRQKDFTKILSDDLRLLPNLRTVRFHNNGISIIKADAFASAQQMEILDLHCNKLKYLPSAVRYLPNLRRLNLGGNEIKMISRSSFVNLRNLQHLVLRRNKLEAIPESLPTSLVKLSLSDNSLGNIRDLRYLENLRILKLDSNRFSQINSRALPDSLKELNLCTNLMSSSSSLSFDNLRQLRRLRLGGNVGITRVSRSTFFRSASPLKELDLRDCGITYVDSRAFSIFPKLRAIDLAGNQLTSYEPEWFVYNQNVRRVNLAGNKWNCDCAFLGDIDDLERAVNDEVDKAKRQETTRRKFNFINDFGSLICGHVASNIEQGSGRLASGQNINLTSVDRSSCPTDRTRWKFEASPYKTKATTTPSVTTTGTTTTTWRPTTTTRRPTTTTRQPTTTTRQPTTTTRQPTATTRRPATTTRRPTTTTRQPWTTTRQPWTTTRQPWTTTRQPTTTTRQPTTTTRQPTTTTRQPWTTSRQPWTTTRQPWTTTRQPTTTTRQPTTTTRQPTTTTRQPTTTTTTRQPTTTTRQPWTTTRPPWTTTRQPTTTTRQPWTTTRQPVTTSILLQGIERQCTVGGIDCELPFTDGGKSHTACIPYGYFGSSTWCYTDQATSTWDYCAPC